MTRIHLSRHRLIAIYRQPAGRSPIGLNPQTNSKIFKPPSDNAEFQNRISVAARSTRLGQQAGGPGAQGVLESGVLVPQHHELAVGVGELCGDPVEQGVDLVRTVAAPAVRVRSKTIARIRSGVSGAALA